MRFPFVLRRTFDVVDEALRQEIHRNVRTTEDLEAAKAQLDNERTRRIAAESIASERRGELDRTLDRLKEMQSEMTRVMGERIRSVDTVNLELMRSRVAEPTPDLSQYQILEKAKIQVVQDARNKHRAVDQAILEKLHPKFMRKPLTPDNVPPVEEVA